jgi:hypothetical protein
MSSIARWIASSRFSLILPGALAAYSGWVYVWISGGNGTEMTPMLLVLAGLPWSIPLVWGGQVGILGAQLINVVLLYRIGVRLDRWLHPGEPTAA